VLLPNRLRRRFWPGAAPAPRKHQLITDKLVIIRCFISNPASGEKLSFAGATMNSMFRRAKAELTRPFPV
jgi:hypothetical protein